MNQRQLIAMVDESVQRSLNDMAESKRDQPHLQSLSLLNASVWLFAVTSPSLGLVPPEFRTAVLYGVGRPAFPYDGLCGDCGQHTSKNYGDHEVGCAFHGERIARHNHLRDVISSTAQSANLGLLLEERDLIPGGDQPANILLSNHAVGQHEAVDVCIVSSLQAQLIDRAAVEPGYALVH